MDKIEKLEYAFGLPPIVDKNLFDKINEIIDYLNQSQKQPDPYVETVGTPVLESTTTYSNTEPEKQQEWREEFENEFATLLRKDFKIYARPIDNPCNAEGDLGNIGEELMEFISQLLSERRKETLEEIYKKFFSLKVEGWEVAGKTYEHPIKIWLEEEVSKLSRQEQ